MQAGCKHPPGRAATGSRRTDTRPARGQPTRGLTGAELADPGADAELTDPELTCAGLTGAELTGAGLTGAELTCAGLTGAELTGGADRPRN